MKYKIFGILALLSAGNVYACDCTQPANYGNPQCAAQITKALAAAPSISQGQGQTQGQGQSVSNSGNSTNTLNAKGGAVTNSGNSTNQNTNTANGGSVSNSGNSAQQQSQNNTGNNTGTSTTTVDSTYKAARIPVNTAYSAGLTSGLDTCLGSASGGVQTVPFGATFGSTKEDKNCVLIKQTKLLAEAGLYKSACIRMTLGKEGEAIRRAMEEAGESCDDVVRTEAVAVPVAPIVINMVVPEVPVVEPPAIVIKPAKHHKHKYNPCKLICLQPHR